MVNCAQKCEQHLETFVNTVPDIPYSHARAHTPQIELTNDVNE